MLTEAMEGAAERAILVGLSAGSLERRENSDEASLDELEALLETAGGLCVAKTLQKRESPDPRTFIGEGKTAELKSIIQSGEAGLVVLDNELSPSQMRVLAEELGVSVIDRSALILDIFAQRAKTREGRIQVELAQYKYILPRLSGLGPALSRLGGGIGTRGPGETKLETDRRHIRRRITALERELSEVRRMRGVQRARRIKNEVPVVAIVGYTNAGKSTLLNALTGAGIPARNRLFDTLDTTTRRLAISDTLEVLISDTVGFIRKLPHHLVEAFKATLEELSYADLLLHVIDMANPEWPEQAKTVEELISELGAGSTPVIEVFNKADLCRCEIMPGGRAKVCISAKAGIGLDRLTEEIGRALDTGRRRVRLSLPYSSAGLVDVLYREAKVERVEYLERFIEVEAVCTARTYGQVREFDAGRDANL